MLCLWIFCIWFLGGFLESVGACESFIDPKGRSQVDFAPPAGFIDFCSRDELMCYLLTTQFPKSVQTIAVFIDRNELEQLSKRGMLRFSRYLIAQRGDMISPSSFQKLKDSIRQGEADKPESSSSDVLQLTESIPLGIVAETTDMIAWGILGRFIPPTNEGQLKQVTMVSIQAVWRLAGESLAIHTREEWMSPLDGGSEPDGESTKTLAKQWIDCIKAKNKN